MSESSEEKTKRKFLKLLNDYEWKHRYSIFYEEPEASIYLLDDMVAFKQRLSRMYPDVAFLTRVQSHIQKRSGERKLQLFLAIYASRNVGKIECDRYFSAPINVLSSPLRPYKLWTIYRSVKKQRSHDLEKVAQRGKPIKRYSCLNKRALVPTDNKLNQDVFSTD